MKWISVKDKHFVDITHKKGRSYEWEGVINEPFIVAVPTNQGWCIQQVVLTDEIGLECHGDDENTYFGWDILDVTHWMKIEPPK